jgi:hypothetical protein
MNPMDPKVGQALKAIEAAYAGQDASHAYYDPKNKIYVLVVSGADADGYHAAVKAIHKLTRKSRAKKPK